MIFEPYLIQKQYWPQEGRHILAHYDSTSIYVYQAYPLNIAQYAVEHQTFGGEFRYERMSWIKPNFLWMMYRSGWAQKEGQERILAIKISQEFFEVLLERAVWSSFHAKYGTHDAWKLQIACSLVRLQWDSDHIPTGDKENRRALQLGLRGHMLQEYGQQQIEEIVDVTSFVAEQRNNIKDVDRLVLPKERAYRPKSLKAIENVELDRC